MTNGSTECGLLRDKESGLSEVAIKFISNIGYGGVRGCLLIINTIVLTPLLIVRLGKEQFALLALMTPFMRYGFNGIFDFGLSTAVVRFISRDYGMGSHTNINKYFTAAMLLYLLACVTLLLLYPVVSPLLLSHGLALHGSVYYTARSTFYKLLCVYLVLLVSNPFFTLLMGIQKINLSHCIGTVSLAVELVGILALIPFGLTLSRVVPVYAVGAILSTGISIILARRCFHQLRLSLRVASQVRDLLHYTVRWSVTVSTSLLPPLIDKLILARFVGLSYVAVYESAAKLVDIMKRATQLFLLPLFPLAGAVIPNQSNGETQSLYRRFFRINLVFSGCLYLLPATLAFVMMTVWLGPELGVTAGWVFLTLSIVGFLLALVTPAALILAGTGEMRLLVVTGLLALTMNVGVTPVLARRIGLSGVLIGTVIAYGSQSLIILKRLQSSRALSLDVRSVLRPGLVVVGSAIIPGTLLVESFRRSTSVSTFAELGLIAFLLYCLGILALKENRDIVAAILKHAAKFTTKWPVSKGARGLSRA